MRSTHSGRRMRWSHLHLSATRGEDPFKVPTMNGVSTTHPTDGARMAVLLHGLTLTGFVKEAAEGEEAEKLAVFRRVRDEIRVRLGKYISHE